MENVPKVEKERCTIRIETERLLVRLMTEDDYDVWLQGFLNRLPSQHKYDEGTIDMSECTKEWFSALVVKYAKLLKEDKTQIFDIFRKEDGCHIGSIDFSTLARDDLQWARIGYSIHNQHWRQGYAKEAVRAALQLAFNELKFHRVEAHINLDNEASVRLAKSVGMEFECIRKGFLFEHEEWVDHLIYSINAPY